MPAVQILESLWTYWKWLCVALVSSCVVLGVLALLLGGFDRAVPDTRAQDCLESGGTWVAEEGLCKAPA